MLINVIHKDVDNSTWLGELSIVVNLQSVEITQNHGQKPKNGFNPKSLANLKHFEPNNRANPGGRPNTADFAKEIRAFLHEKVQGKERLRSLLLRIAQRDPKVLLYYAFGKPQETINVQNPDGSALQSQVLVLMAQALANQEQPAIDIKLDEPG